MVLTQEKRTSPPTRLDQNGSTRKPLRQHDYRTFLTVHYPQELAASQKLFDLHRFTVGNPRRDRLDACRKTAWFVRHKDTGEVRVRSITCGDRWCPMCSRSRRLTIAANVRDWILTVRRPKHLTLTLVSSHDPLPDQLDRLYKAFTALRATKAWKAKVRGGVWFLHCHWRLSKGWWRPHLHCIIDADYFHQDQISNLWQQITGDSYVVDIRAINNTDKIANYVSREAAKPVNLADLNDTQLRTIFSSFYGRKLFGAWGTAAKLHLLAQPRRVREDWETVGNWGTVIMFAGDDMNAHKIISCWLAKRPLDPGVNINHIDDTLNDVPREIQPEPPPKQLYFGAVA